MRRNTSQTGISLEQTETKESLQPRSTMKHWKLGLPPCHENSEPVLTSKFPVLTSEFLG